MYSARSKIRINQLKKHKKSWVWVTAVHSRPRLNSFRSHSKKGKFLVKYVNLASAKYINLVILLMLSSQTANAAEFESALKNLVDSFTGRILPILSLGYLAKNIFGHIKGDPIAKEETVRVVVAIVCLLGLNGVWAYISKQAR